MTSTISRPASSPLWAVFAFTFVNSVGSGVITTGIYFISRHGYGFTQAQDFLLGVLLGLTYIVGAFGTGPLLRMLRSRLPGSSGRRFLVGLMVLMALLAALPAAISLATGVRAGAGSRWPIWVLVLTYTPLSGCLWPVVESFVSGGRSAATLRDVIGRWSIVWSGAVALAYFGMAPLVRSSPEWALMLAAGSHVLGLALLVAFASEPAPHAPDEHAPHPPVYRDLLLTFRWLLPLSYVVSSAMGPYLPTAMKSLGLSETAGTQLAATWLVARCLTFGTLGKWHAWHGRWAMPVVGILLLFGGFAAVVLGPLLLPSLGETAGRIVLAGGLTLFGVGMATIYTGAIYYAMEVGSAEVDAGGMHETLIGVGYTLGPLCGLLASAGVEQGLIPGSSIELPMLAIVTIIGLVVGGLTLSRVRKLAGREPESGASH